MKLKTIILLAGLTLGMTACKSDDYTDGTTPLDNAAYLDAARIAPDSRVTFKKTVTELERELRVLFLSPVSRATDVTLRVDAAAVAVYNQRHGTDYGLLDAAHYDLSATSVRIEAGKHESQPIIVHFKGLEALDIDQTALLPITITGTSTGIGVLDGSERVYYLVRRSSAITTAANLADGYLWVPSFETPEGRAAVNGLEALTFEALIHVNDFTGDAGISSVMGVEQHCLLRLGDTGFPRQQLQTQISGSKFPEADKSKQLQAGEWYHVALTWDIASTAIRIYVNGQLQSEGSLAYDKPSIDLARAEESAYRFLIGYSYNTGRLLNGMISQVRVWSVVRTPEQIWRDMYDVEVPDTKPELRAYWKCDEGAGDVVRDWSQYGNDARCLAGDNEFESGARKEGTLEWNNSIEIPQLNKEQ